MKRKSIFIALAFILAIASAFTTRPTSEKPFSLVNGYLKADCSTVAIQCDNIPGYACTVSGGAQAFSDATTCKVALVRSTP
jgi:hypothetical protein